MATLKKDPTSSHRLYFTSYLLVYYFMHLDGKGDSQRFLHYFREIQSQRKEMESYRASMTEFFKKPGVKDNGNGTYSFSSDITPPKVPVYMVTPGAKTAFQKKTLGILLDGRSEDDLMKEIRTAYSRLGIKL